MNTLKSLRAEYEAMPADVRNGDAGQSLADSIKEVIKEKKRASTPRRVGIVADGNLRPPQGDYKPQTVEGFKKELSERMAAGKQSAIVLGDDGEARIVDLDAVKELREIRTANMKQIKAMLKPMPVEVRKSGNSRNLPCPCGSGRKFKKCCFFKDEPIHITP